MQRTCLVLLLIASSLACCRSASAQAPASTPSSRNAPPPGFDLSGIYAHMIDSILDQLATPETAAKLAKFQKQHYDALVKEGFSHEDAMRIVASTGIPFMSSGK